MKILKTYKPYLNLPLKLEQSLTNYLLTSFTDYSGTNATEFGPWICNWRKMLSSIKVSKTSSRRKIRKCSLFQSL